MDVGCLHLQGVGLLGLKVQWLLGRTKMDVFCYWPRRTGDGNADGWELGAFLKHTE